MQSADRDNGAFLPVPNVRQFLQALDGTMRPLTLQQSTAVLGAVALVATIVLGIYMARPWGDNYAYENLTGYLGLFAFLAWACGPYIYLIWISRTRSSMRASAISRLAVALLVCVGGIVILIDTAFIHIDAQGGLIFIFLPIYQWLLIVVFEVVGYFVGSYGAT